MRALHRDTGGGLRWGAIGQFTTNPVYGMHPSQALQVPPMSGPGGYTKPPDGSTPTGAVIMAMQPHASGGEVDGDALAHASRLLHCAKRAEGGRLDTEVDPNEREAKRLLALWDRVEKENPRVSADRQFSYLAQRSPGISKFLRKLLQDGYSRSGARATIHGALVRAAK
jgi:hypothetical protein